MKQFQSVSLNYLKYLVHRLIVGISPKLEINRCFKKTFGHKANLENPQSLIEKIYWMQLHCDTRQWTLFADKFRVREFIESKGFAAYLPKLYGVWKSPNEIDIDSLPNSFVLKANNGCATVSVIKNKAVCNWDSVKREMNNWFKYPFGYSGYEPHYLHIPPCIIAEELLVQNPELTDLSPNSMVDFKFWCFNGHVECCLVTYGREKGSLFIDLYDSKWNRIVSNIVNYGIEKINPTVIVPKPQCLDKMLEIASSLSKGQPEMRVDMYLVDDKPVIGELTMSSGYGYFTENYYNYLGSFVDVSLLPQKR